MLALGEHFESTYDFSQQFKQCMQTVKEQKTWIKFKIISQQKQQRAVYNFHDMQFACWNVF